MILEPHHLWRLTREMDVPAAEMFEQKLMGFHGKHVLGSASTVLIPRYWAETVYYGLKKMVDEWPQIRFGSVYAESNTLKIYTVPSHRPVEVMKFEIYNQIDDLIIEAIDRLLKGPKKPQFLI